jgi:Butirosin biosynthesis protein H, N-terminal/Domain of unknown function (DUF4872)
MPVLHDYTQFGHTHWATGTLTSVLAYSMDDPLSEALLLGISGGIVAGYNVSDGKLPYLNLLTRSPFHPLDTIIERLKLPTDDRRTSRPERASAYLHEALSAGHAVIVWVDTNELPYTVMPTQEPIQPVVVYGYEDETVYLTDRAHLPLRVAAAAFERARSHAVSEQYRQMTVGAPHQSRLALAARLGIESCLRDFLEEPPLKELRGTFGLAAFEHWIQQLESPAESGWHKQYPPGRRLIAILTSAYQSINLNGTGGNGSRAMFADFLDEAADLLDKPLLHTTAGLWRANLRLWSALNDALLPAEIADFAHLRSLMQSEYDLFLLEGLASLPIRQEIRQQMDELKTQMGRKFPLTKRQVGALLDNLRDVLLAIYAAESTAVHDLKAVMLAVGV